MATELHEIMQRVQRRWWDGADARPRRRGRMTVLRKAFGAFLIVSPVVGPLLVVIVMTGNVLFFLEAVAATALVVGAMYLGACLLAD